MTSFVSDVRYAFRMLRKHWLLSVSAICTMALVIGANTSIFALVYGVLLKPLSLPDPGRIVRIEEQHQGRRLNVTGATFSDLRERTRTLRAVAAYRILSPGLSAPPGSPEQVLAAEVTSNYFDVLGVAPAAGRWFAATDFVSGSAHTVIVSDGLWRRRFGSDRTVLGRQVSIDGVPTEIVGVAPSRMFSPGTPDIWIPATRSAPLLNNRRAHLFTVIARVDGPYSFESTEREMDVLSSVIGRDSGNVDPGLRLITTPLQARLIQNARPAILALWAGVSLLMLIAAANIANLLLMHGSARARELSIRIAVGAGRARIVRQLATESVLLTCAGGLLGTCLGFWSVRALRVALPVSIPRANDLTGDPVVVLFGVGVSLVMALIFALPFTLRTSMLRPADALRSRIASGAAHSRSRSILVVAEVTLTAILLCGAGLLGRSLWSVLQVEPGFNPSNVLTFRVSLPPAKYPDAGAHHAFYQSVLDRIIAVPGVVAAGVTGALPLTGTPVTTMEPERSTATEQLSADVVTATPEFFAALEIPLRQGRSFTPTDRKGTHAVMVINEAAARRFWPDGSSPLGRRITMKDWGTAYQAEVVGVVGDVHQAGSDSEVSPAVYYPLSQFPETTLTESIVVRAEGNLAQTVSMVKDQIWAVDSSQPIAAIRTMDEIMSVAVAERRFNLVVLSAFAVAAVLLSAIGIYGIVAFAVAERRHEFGVRIALGAPRSDLVRVVMTHAARPVAIGLAAGLGGVLTIVSVTLLACAAPVRRALRLDPVAALRDG
jgi:putative ABC transport system permease protein